MLLATRHIVPFALLLLSGCATVSGGPDGATGGADAADRAAPVSRTSAGDARRIGAAARGERVTLAPGTLSGTDEVVVGETYAAASGRRCRRLLGRDGAPLERIACGGGERWRIVRSLSPRETDRGAPPAASVVPVVE